jgi:threonine dehydrogenase-like Zn-dependent dehydrogenase
VPFTIACGNCLFCKKKIWAACDNSNPNAHLMEAAYGYSGSGLFGYSHMMGGYAGVRRSSRVFPSRMLGHWRLRAIFLMKRYYFFPISSRPGNIAAENAQIQPGDTVAVWGCGPVGQFAIASAFMLGAARVITIDRLPERLEMARSLDAIVVDYSEEDVSVLTALKDLAGGIGPNACIDAVGLEAYSAVPHLPHPKSSFYSGRIWSKTYHSSWYRNNEAIS